VTKVEGPTISFDPRMATDASAIGGGDAPTMAQIADSGEVGHEGLGDSDPLPGSRPQRLAARGSRPERSSVFSSINGSQVGCAASGRTPKVTIVIAVCKNKGRPLLWDLFP
jgi:hypothetical protein